VLTGEKTAARFHLLDDVVKRSPHLTGAPRPTPTSAGSPEPRPQAGPPTDLQHRQPPAGEPDDLYRDALEKALGKTEQEFIMPLQGRRLCFHLADYRRQGHSPVSRRDPRGAGHQAGLSRGTGAITERRAEPGKLSGAFICLLQ